MLVRSLGRALAALSAVCFVLGTLGKLHWFFDLFSHFRPHYAAALLLATLVLLGTKDRVGGLASLIVAIVVAWPVIGDVARPRTALAQEPNPELAVLTVNAWFRNGDTARLAQAIEDSGADVVIVQELDRRRMLELLRLLRTYPHSALDAAEDRHGAAIVSRWPILAAEAIALDQSNVRAQRVTLNWQNRAVEVLGVHLTWPMSSALAQSRNTQWATLIEWMKTQRTPWIVAGDLNLTPWSPYFAHASVPAIQHCFEHRRYIGTWPASVALFGIQIDHCFASRHWNIASVKLLPQTGSDHRPVLMRVQPRGAAPTALP